jgi:serine/threonine-protein kinase
MGEVYLAEDPHIERKLAIKTVRLAGREQDVEERKRRLLREARAAGRLLHPHVVTLFDAGEVEGMLYLAFEFVEGQDLAARLESSALSLYEVLRIVRETAEALEFAHRHGIVHRDIKPSNVLLDTHGRVKVTDFGIAKVTGQSTELTIAGSVMGSPQYLSPEQIRGEELDGRSDIFSLGVVLYELLSGKRPFDGDTITTLVYQILNVDPPPISALRGDLPPRVEALLAGMLAKDPAERVQSAAQVAEELAAIERELPDETLAGPAAGNTERLIPTKVLPGYSTGLARPATATVKPAAPAPAAPAATVAAPKPGRAGLVLGLAAVVVLAFLLGGAWLVWRSWRGRDSQVAATVSPPQPPSAAGQTAPPAGTAAFPAESGAPGAASPGQPPSSAVPPGPRIGEPVAQRPPTQPSVPQDTARRDQTPPGRAGQAPPGPAPAVVPAPPASREPAPSVSAEASARDAAPAEEPAEPARRDSGFGTADRRMQTGIELAFRVTPPDAYVLVNGTVIGQAQAYSGLKGKPTYQLPGPGEHLIKLRKAGMRELRIGVTAAGAGTTPVVARLEPMPTEQVETVDLQSVRVREAVGFRVQPESARVLVDGSPVGTAAQFAGRMGRPDSWLELSPGLHRVTLAAPGFRSREIAVEVTGGAERERERIEVRLAREGG